MKKFLSIALAVTISAASFVGCSPKTNQNTGSSDNVSELSFTVFNPTFGESPIGKPIQNEWQKMAEEYMGMKINITWKELPWADYIEKMKIYIAANELDDVFMHNGTVSETKALGETNLILDIMKYKDNIKYYNKFLDGDNYGRSKLSTPEGSIYGFADASYRANYSSPYMWGFRFDVFQKNNIPIPSTMDEVYTSAKKLKSIYPDSYPVGSDVNNDTYNLLSTMYLTNRTSDTIYYNGLKYVYAPIDEETRFKGVLQYLNKLYSEKLLDPEFFTRTEDQQRKWAMTGRNFITPDTYNVSMNAVANKENNGVIWGTAAIPKGLDGQRGWAQWCATVGNVISDSFSTVVSAQAKHPDLIVKLLDYQYSQEMMDLSNWGIKGQTYEVAEDGTKSYLPAIKNADNMYEELMKFGVQKSGKVRPGIQFMPQDQRTSTQDAARYMPTYENGEYKTQDVVNFSDRVNGGKDIVCPSDLPYVSSMNSDDMDKQKSIMTPIDTYVRQCAYKFVLGEMSFDKWGEFIAKIKSLGDYQSVVDMMNEKMQHPQ